MRIFPASNAVFSHVFRSALSQQPGLLLTSQTPQVQGLTHAAPWQSTLRCTALKSSFMDPAAARVAVFLHSGEYDRCHQALSIAAAATAANRPVDLFFFWWALERLVQGRLSEPDFEPPREDVADRFEKHGAPTLAQLLAHIRESNKAVVYACSGSLPLLGLDLTSVEKHVDQVVGWSRILQITAGVVDRFYL
jgi:peroxiredoxin family protein